MFPPITALRERVVPEGGDTIHGNYIQEGTCIGFNLPGLLTNSIFGSDPKVFRPERWLEASPDQLEKMERVHELMFNYGFTRCLGIGLANMVLGKFMVEVVASSTSPFIADNASQVLRRWDVTSTRPQKPWESRCHGIFYQKDFFVRITAI